MRLLYVVPRRNSLQSSCQSVRGARLLLLLLVLPIRWTELHDDIDIYYDAGTSLTGIHLHLLAFGIANDK